MITTDEVKQKACKVDSLLSNGLLVSSAIGKKWLEVARVVLLTVGHTDSLLFAAMVMFLAEEIGDRITAEASICEPASGHDIAIA